MNGAARRLRAFGGIPLDALRIGLGLGVLGLSSYVFLALAARSLDASAYADLAVLWTLFNVVGPGLFAPVELEVGRAVADRRARGEGVWPVVTRALLVTGTLTVALVAVGLLLAPALVPRLLGSHLLLFALLASFPGVALASLTRGLLAGQHLVGRYALQLGAEGAFRIALAVVLFGAATGSAGVFGMSLALSAVLAVAVSLPPAASVRSPGPPAAWREFTGAVGWLTATSLLQQLLVNSGPIISKLSSSPSDRLLAGPVLAGVVLTRLPLFLFTAVQALLLPRLAGQLGRGDHAGFVRGLRSLLGVVGIVGVLGCAAAAVAGPPLLQVLFGPRFVLAPGALAGLAAGSGLYMAAVVLNHSLVALRAHALATLSWAVGAVVFVLVLVVGNGVVGRVVWSYVLGCGAALVCLALSLRQRVRVLPAGAGPVPGQHGGGADGLSAATGPG